MPISVPEHLSERYGSRETHFQEIYEHLIKPGVEGAGLVCTGPGRQGTENIQAAIINDLHDSDLVVADLSGLNANVFLELGIRSALDRPVCLIWDGQDRLPFDTNTLNTHRYNPKPEMFELRTEISHITAHVRDTLEKNRDGRNALWKFFGRALQTDLSPGVINADDVSLPSRLEDMQNKLARIEALMRSMTPYAPLQTNSTPESRTQAHLPLALLTGVRDRITEELKAESPVHGSRVKRLVLEMLGDEKYEDLIGSGNLNAALGRIGVPIITDNSGNFYLAKTLLPQAPSVGSGEPEPLQQ